MDPFEVSADRLGIASKQCARRLLDIGQNRLDLLTLEIQEGFAQAVQAVLLALGMAVLGLLGAMTLTAALVVQLWALSPVGVLLGLSLLYGIGGWLLQRRLGRLLQEWRLLDASMDQLRKDRACLLEKVLT